MRRNATIATILVACALAIPAGGAAAATTKLNVRIEGRTGTLFEGPILTEGHAVRSYKGAGGSEAEDLAEHGCDGTNKGQHATPGPTPTAASVDAMETIGETQAMAGQWYPGFDDYLVKQWGAGPENAESGIRAWGLLVNNVYTSIGGCQYRLDAGDEPLWVYNAFSSRPLLALLAGDAHYTAGERPLTATAALGVPFDVEVVAYEDNAEDIPPSQPERAGSESFAGAEVAPVATTAKGFETLQLGSPETVTTDAKGKASVTFTTPGWHRLKAGAPVNLETGEEEAVRSNRLDVCVPAPGETGCGAPPSEDLVRTPPRYLVTPPAGPAGNGNPASGGHTSTGDPGTGHVLGAGANRPALKLTVVSATATRLVLRVSQPASVTVKLARRARAGRHARWLAVKTIKASAHRAGTLTVRLGRLRPGTYRASVGATTVKPVVEILVVRGRR
jgi:hypothetical protein